MIMPICTRQFFDAYRQKISKLLIDGGKGQLESSIKAIEAHSLKIPVISIAKREEEIIIHATRSNINTTYIESMRKTPDAGIFVERSNDFYIVNLHPDQRNASSHSKNLQGSTFSKYSDLTKLFQRIRDESHRFAVSYHTVLKRQKQTASILEEIPGIGPTTRRTLIKKLGSLRAVEAATEAELSAVVGEKKAQTLIRFLKNTSS
jgi:excinuclease ABC subunit C